MTTTFPFSFLKPFANRLQPPEWVVDEAQQRLVLLLNHVIQQEKQAQERLIRQQGRIVHIRFGVFALDLLITPAGLTDRAPSSAKADLVLSVPVESPLVMLQSALAGKVPAVKIEGDVQLAAEVGWLADNLRWDVEEDLSRVVGDAPAHALVQAGRKIAEGLRSFLSRSPPPATAKSGTDSPASVSTAFPSGPRAPE
jgi:ubiquinone biosynthesis accessory factor UbiJ